MAAGCCRAQEGTAPVIRFSTQIIALIVLGAVMVRLIIVAADLVKAPAKPGQMPAVSPVPTVPAQQRQQPLPRRPAVSSTGQTLSRPIFFKNRKFPSKATKTKRTVTPVVVTAPPAVSTDTFKLLGLVIDVTGKRALIKTQSLPQSWYKEGMRIENWTIMHIGANDVQLSLNGNDAVLKLYSQSAGD